MSYSLKFTVKAKNNYAQNLDYLKKDGVQKVAMGFIDMADVVLETIRENPFLYP